MALPEIQPNGFVCPYKRQCLTRELMRWLMPALLAIIATKLAS